MSHDDPSTNSIADDLSIAASLGSLNEVSDLLRSNANPNVHDYRGWYAMHWASQEGCDKIVKLLIEHGADVNAQTVVEGITPLMQAAGGGHVEVVRILLAAGADPMVKTSIGLSSPLEAAEKFGHKEVAIVLKIALDDRFGSWS